MVISKSAFLSSFLGNLPEKEKIEVSTQMMRDLVSPDYDLSDLINYQENSFYDEKQIEFQNLYILLLNRELSNIFESQIDKKQETTSFYESIANYIGFTKEAIMTTLYSGTMSIILGAVGVAILVFLGFSAGYVITLAFLKAFLGFLVNKFKKWLGDKISENYELSLIHI